MMKRFLIEMLSLTAMLMTACVAEEPFPNVKEDAPLIAEAGSTITISAIQADNPSTRTSLSEDGLSILWNPGDEINLFYGESGSIKLTADTNSPSATTTFTGTLGEGDEPISGDEPVWAVYPYNESNTSDGQSVTITVPNMQTAVEGSFDKDALITVAHSSGSNLAFYNVCGGIKFQVIHEGIDKISIFGPWKENIAGTVKVMMGTDGKPVYSIVDGKAIITVNAPDEDGFKVGVWYYVVCLPMEFEDGITIQLRHDYFWDDDQTLAHMISRPLEIKRAVWGRLTITEGFDLDSDIIPSNQIWYKATSKISVGSKLSVATHTFSNGRGIITYSNNVTSIPESYFEDQTSITKIGLPEGVTAIGRWAFTRCSSLTSINIPTGVTRLSVGVFNGCSSLKSIRIPSSVRILENRAFDSCTSLSSITIPDSVTSIGVYAFHACKSLTSITIPEGVTSIGDSAFSNCTSLSSVTIPDSVTSFGEHPFVLCSSLESFSGKYSSPDGLFLIDSGIIIAVACGAMNGEITLPPGVTSIGDSVFSYCTSLTSITIPDSVTSIGDYAFSYCTSLTSITIPDSVTSIGDYAFSQCTSLTSITIPDSVTSIGDYAFSNCTSLTSITIPDSVTSIGDSVFSNCTSLTSITIPDSVTSIGGSAFRACKSLTSITIPDSVTSIGASAFFGCSSLKSIRIPSSVTSIGQHAFNGCSGATRLSVGSGVTSIDHFAFMSCKSLQTILIYSMVPPSLKSDAFNDTGNCDISVPSESLTAYKNATGWKDCSSRLVGM